jgi:hypothetical protein
MIWRYRIFRWGSLCHFPQSRAPSVLEVHELLGKWLFCPYFHVMLPSSVSVLKYTGCHLWISGAYTGVQIAKVNHKHFSRLWDLRCSQLCWWTLESSCIKRLVQFYVLLTVHLGIIFVNSEFDAQFFFMYVYFYSLHVSGTHVPIIRRINCINTTSGICHSV